MKLGIEKSLQHFRQGLMLKAKGFKTPLNRTLQQVQMSAAAAPRVHAVHCIDHVRYASEPLFLSAKNKSP